MPDAAQKLLSEEQRRVPIALEKYGVTVFPNGQPRSFYELAQVSGADIDKRRQFFLAHTGASEESLRMIYDLYIVGCVDYQFSFGGEQHQTGFICELFREKEDGRAWTIFIGENVPKSELKLRSSRAGDGVTD